LAFSDSIGVMFSFSRLITTLECLFSFFFQFLISIKCCSVKFPSLYLLNKFCILLNALVVHFSFLFRSVSIGEETDCAGAFTDLHATVFCIVSALAKKSLPNFIITSAFCNSAGDLSLFREVSSFIQTFSLDFQFLIFFK
jgi:hypothetical protein